MTSSGWSSLLLGTFLATTAVGSALGQTARPVEAATAAVAEPAQPGSTADLIIDPAALANAARAADTIADEMVDRIMTGSIFPVQAGPRTGGLTEVRGTQASGLTEPKIAPEPAAKAQPASLTAPVASEPAAKPDATPAPAPAAETAAPTPAAPPAVAADPAPAPSGTAEAVETPAEAVKPAESATAPSAPAEAAAAPKPEAAAAPAVTAATPETTEAKPAAETPAPTDKAAEAAPEPAKPAEAAAVATETPAVAAAPAAAPETTPVAAAPEKPADVAGYTTASEPAKPAAAPTVPTAEPAKPAAVVVSAPAAILTAPAPVSVAAAPAPVVAAPAPVVAKAAEPATTASTTAPAVVAAPAAPAPAPAAVAAPTPSTDAAIAATLAAEKAAAALKGALEDLQPLAGSVEERADRAALLAFYADRAFLPLFVDAQGTTDRARAVASVLALAGDDGLQPRDYALPRFEAGLEPELRARAEIAFAQTVVRYARHLQTGRFDPGRVHELVTPKPPKTEAREVLAKVAGSTAVAATLSAYAPPHEGYRRLKAMLAELRAAAPEAPMVMVPVGPTLKPGQKDARVALLRERLGVAGIVSDADVYDPSLAQAVKAFQRDRGLPPNGTIGRETVSALNGEKTGTAARIADLVSNMERWRWLPRDLGDLHVFVNVPDFHLDVMKDGRSIHHARVIVGRPSNQTPVFSDVMRHVVVNPYWNVPYSIVKKEMLGKLQSTAGQSLGRSYEVRVGNQMVDPTTVDWATVSPAKVSIRQRPGGGNALGNIKFLFPNQHAVYLHDTSSRSLFAQSFRALSHGCVRVHEPFSFADAVLSEEPEAIDGARLKKMIGGNEKTINLVRQVPVHINYFTAWVDDAGQLQARPDIYGHDAKVKRLLGL